MMHPFMPLFAVIALTMALPAHEPYRSPFDMAVSGERVLISDRTARCCYLLDAESGSIRNTIALQGAGSGVAWSEQLAYVAEYDAGSIAVIDASSGRISKRLACGPKPLGLALVGAHLAVAEYGLHRIEVLDPASGETLHQVPVARYPWFVTAVPDGRTLAVGHLIPELAATDPQAAASVSLVDVAAGRLRAQVRLPYGSTNVRELVCSPDGRWLYVLHTIGRVALPTTMLERGWINTNAISLIDLKNDNIHASLLLDQVTRGAADPWGLAVSPDGSEAWISIAGTQELMRLDLAGLHGLLDGTRKPGKGDAYSGSAAQVWNEVQVDPAKRDKLSYHLSALYGAGLTERLPLPVAGPRAVRMHTDGSLLVAGYYDGSVLRLDPRSGDEQIISLGAQPAPDDVRLGEALFHDARPTFQQWLSCVSCHPDGRADGLNWDLGNDGIGNSKNAKSLLYSAHTPPAMSTGVRESFEAAVGAGMFFQMQAPDPDRKRRLLAYLAAMEAEPSPHLVAGELSPAARRGKSLFESRQVGCGHCHRGPYLSDLQAYDVGTRGPRDRVDAFDTPTLRELWRSGPYLHDGRSVDLMSVISTHNVDDRHGQTSQLSEAERQDLVAYLRSL